jgi:hypothetical protein
LIFSESKRISDDARGLVILAGIGQRVTQERCVANRDRRVIGDVFAHALEAIFEDPYSAVRCAKRRIRPSKRRIEVGPSMRRRHGLVAQRCLEPLDGDEVLAPSRGGESERDPRPCRRDGIARGGSLVQDRLELLFRPREVVGEAELELGIRKPKLAVVDLADIAPGLQVFDGDTKLLRQLPKRLHRRRPCPGLDAGDVRVRHPRRREVALRQTPL